MLGVKRKSSVIVDQEVDFPRGGGTTLTPFEHQQVLREVKAEANAAKRARSTNDEKKGLEKQRANRERKNAIKKKNVSNGVKEIEEIKKERKSVRIERLNLKRLNTETRLLCCIQAVHPLYLLLSLPDRLYGRVPITNISSILTSRLESFADADDDSSSASSSSSSESGDEKEKMPELNKLYQKGQWVIASVVTKSDPKDLKGKARGINKDSLNVELTLDPKIVNEGITSADLSPGYLLPMTVKSKEDNGYLMNVGFGSVNGFISFKEATASLSVGQVVNASVLSVSVGRRSILASLKESKVINSKVEIAPSLTALLPGNLVRGLITAKSDRGVMVKLFGLFDASVASYHLNDSECKVGQHVVGRVLWTSLDSFMEERKIALSGKQFVVKLVGGGSKAETAIKEEKPKAINGFEVTTRSEKKERKDPKEVQKEEKIKVNGEDIKSQVQEIALSDDEEDESAADGEEVDRSDSESESDNEGKAPKATALELPGGLSWTAGAAAIDSSDSENEDAVEPSKTTKRKGKGVTYQEDLTATLATKTPDTIQDFERLLLGSPNSSFLWIQYMSFQLQLGDIQKGRETGRRALQVINFREEQEKFNIWIALLNLENTFGSEESLEEVYKEACAYNDDKKISLRFVEILEKSGKDAEEHWKKVTKRFGRSSKVWVEYHRFLLRMGKDEEARAMIPRSMQSLEKRKHVKTIVACALDDFKMGGVERGRTIFEGLVDTYPKRLDIWLQYIDQESRLKNTSGVRDLFERILALKQSSKKVKSVLKKWLEYEKTFGDAKGEQSVLDRARRFVEERSAAKEESEVGED